MQVIYNQHATTNQDRASIEDTRAEFSQQPNLTKCFQNAQYLQQDDRCRREILKWLFAEENVSNIESLLFVSIHGEALCKE